MAAFHINQRVRIVSPGSVFDGKNGVIWSVLYDNWIWNATETSRHIAPVVYRVEVDGRRKHPHGRLWIGYEQSDLRPLLPPDEKAESFIARIKRLGSEPVNDAPKVTVREGK